MFMDVVVKGKQNLQYLNLFHICVKNNHLRNYIQTFIWFFEGAQQGRCLDHRYLYCVKFENRDINMSMYIMLQNLLQFTYLS